MFFHTSHYEIIDPGNMLRYDISIEKRIAFIKDSVMINDKWKFRVKNQQQKLHFLGFSVLKLFN